MEAALLVQSREEDWANHATPRSLTSLGCFKRMNTVCFNGRLCRDRCRAVKKPPAPVAVFPPPPGRSFADFGAHSSVFPCLRRPVVTNSTWQMRRMRPKSFVAILQTFLVSIGMMNWEVAFGWCTLFWVTGCD